jgi:hypothetical protein
MSGILRTLPGRLDDGGLGDDLGGAALSEATVSPVGREVLAFQVQLNLIQQLFPSLFPVALVTLKLTALERASFTKPTTASVSPVSFVPRIFCPIFQFGPRPGRSRGEDRAPWWQGQRGPWWPVWGKSGNRLYSTDNDFRVYLTERGYILWRVTRHQVCCGSSRCFPR